MSKMSQSGLNICVCQNIIVNEKTPPETPISGSVFSILQIPSRFKAFCLSIAKHIMTSQSKSPCWYWLFTSVPAVIMWRYPLKSSDVIMKIGISNGQPKITIWRERGVGDGGHSISKWEGTCL